MNTQQRILDYLASHPTATATQIGTAFQLSPANIRHHLSGLVREGLVEGAGATSTGERGRPRTLFRLAPRARRDNLAGLASALLHVLAAGDANIDLGQLAADLAGNAQQTPSQGSRLVRAIHRLNQLHYEARWEAHAGAPVILFGNCPYAPIIADHPELCRMDAALIAHLSGLLAEQVAKLKPNPQGAIQCIFRITGRAGN
jgi:predicted ArsR family transcriptional regulator